LRTFAEVLKKPGFHPSVEFRVPHKDGSWRHLEHVISNLLNDASIRGVIVNSWDITERKQAEEEVQRLNATLEKKVVERTAQLADRERRLEDLVGKLITAQEEERRRVAYEVHDSLTQMAIATQRYVQTFAATHPPGSEVRPGELDRPLTLARQTVQEARRVVKGLRPTTLDDFGLATAVRQRVEELQDEGWEIGYEETLGGERLPTEVETTLYRVTQEALNNVQKHARTTEARVALTRQGRKVRLEVRDEGRGFDPSAVSCEGSPVERVGLSSMQERIVLLGGELEIRSEPGAGTSVIAEVPLPATGVPTMKDEAAPPARLLIVDDHDLVRASTQLMLEGAPDLEVVGEAVNGRHALELCRRLCPDLVLMDVRMPEMDGLTATRAIKEEMPSISILLVSAYDSEDYRREARSAGAVGYVLKDADMQQLLEAVRMALGRRGEG
jgi:signal transduction histidine kinase/CheY-like chemotaxis protein